MPATAFDTLHAKQVLTEAGVSDAHADAIVVMTRNAVTEGVATKTDIADIKTDIVQIDAKIENTAAQLRSDVKADIAKLEGNMLRLAIGIVVVIGNSALTVALIKLFL